MNVFGDKDRIAPSSADAVSQLLLTVEIHSSPDVKDYFVSKFSCSASIEAVSLINFVSSSQRRLPSRPRKFSCALCQYGTARLNSDSPTRVRCSRRSLLSVPSFL